MFGINTSLGQFLLNYAVKYCVEISRLSGCQIVIVDAKDEKLKAFYMRYGGFVESEQSSLRLYLPIATLRKLLG